MREPDLVLSRDDGSIYLNRWHVIPRNRFFNIYLHQFLGSDDDRALHDHPWWFASLVLKGGYWEHRVEKVFHFAEGEGTRHYQTWRGRWSFAMRKAETAHRVQLDEKPVFAGYLSLPHGLSIRRNVWQPQPAWTLVFTGPKYRSWGFHCPQGWIHWKRFDKRNGCGEK